MGERAEPLQDWRERVLSDPDLILDDRDVMRALITANDRQMGGNIVDCLLYTSPSPRDLSTSRMPSSA